MRNFQLSLQNEMVSMMGKKEVEISNIKNPDAFNPSFFPPEIFVREELKQVIEEITEYDNIGVAENMIIYGFRGSGKTVSLRSITKILEKIGKKGTKTIFVNVRENPSERKIYSQIADKNELKGLDTTEIKKLADKNLEDRTILILDEIDFLKNYDILYHLVETKILLILITQKIYWYEREMTDESIKSRMKPTHITFSNYNITELNQILKSRADLGLNSYSETGISELASLICKEYRSDVRIGIKALKLLGKLNKWDYTMITKAAYQAAAEVEGDAISDLSYRNLMVLYLLQKHRDTNKTFAALSDIKDPNSPVGTITKPTFLNSVWHLQNIGLVLLVPKREGRYSTFETQILLSDPAMITNEIKRRQS